MQTDSAVQAIRKGKTALGIELGSTRIKAVLIGPDRIPLASGGHSWQNRLEDGVWTYHLEDVWTGLQNCYRNLAAEVERRYGEKLTTVGAMGFSAMMHGYLAFDEAGSLLVPFRTWRNTMTGPAAAELTELLSFNIPQRWSIAHLDQAILNGESHVRDIRFLTTLSGFIHWKLTGQKVLGVGDASGMFPIDSLTGDYDAAMLEKYDARAAGRGMPWRLRQILPAVLPAGVCAGVLTEEGARLLDPSGTLRSGIPLCPPEGDAGTGMVATNSVAPRTGNVSAGTSIFAMIVLEKPLSRVYPEIDLVATPTGAPVVMAHCNNFTSDLNAWTRLFQETAEALGAKVDEDRLFEVLFRAALEGEPDCGGLVSYNYYAGEPVTGLTEGRPLLARMPDSRLSLGNFMRAQIFGAMGTLKLGMDILMDEQIRLERLVGHGGFFRTKGVGQRLMAAAMGTPVTVMETAGEGGAWGIALLSDFMAQREPGQPLETYLAKHVFAGSTSETVAPDSADQVGFRAFMERYTRGLSMERAAVEAMR